MNPHAPGLPLPPLALRRLALRRKARIRLVPRLKSNRKTIAPKTQIRLEKILGEETYPQGNLAHSEGLDGAVSVNNVADLGDPPHPGCEDIVG